MNGTPLIGVAIGIDPGDDEREGHRRLLERRVVPQPGPYTRRRRVVVRWSCGEQG